LRARGCFNTPATAGPECVCWYVDCRLAGAWPFALMLAGRSWSMSGVMARRARRARSVAAVLILQFKVLVPKSTCWVSWLHRLPCRPACALVDCFPGSATAAVMARLLRQPCCMQHASIAQLVPQRQPYTSLRVGMPLQSTLVGPGPGGAWAIWVPSSCPVSCLQTRSCAIDNAQGL
jgi:hypothetical protein